MSQRTNKPVVWLYALLMLALGLVLTAALPGTPTTQGRAHDTVLPEIVLPGDGATVVDTGNQDNPQIAAGGGMYLVVWEDSRTNYVNFPDNASPSGGDSGGQTLKDIYAARLDSNGQLLDTTPIVVSQATRSQTVPQVAWNGQNWLVVWNSERQANYSYTKDIMAARVSPQGLVLDNPAITVDGNPTIDELWPTVASDGTNWVVVWMDQGAYFELDATRIGRDGTVLDTGGIAIHTPGFPDAPYNAAMTFAGDEYLVVWSGDNQIKARRFSTSLQPLGGVFVVGSGGNFPEVSTNGTDFFVAWQFGYDTYGARVTHAGQVLDPSGINISGTNGGYPYPDVGWDGTNWLVTWVPYSDYAMLARVSTGGQLLDPSGILVSSNAYVSAVAGRPGGGARLVWTDFHLSGLGRGDIYGAEVSAGGVPGTPAPVSMGAPRQTGQDLAPNGSGYLAVFQSAVSGETRIKGQRLNADGDPIDTEPFLIAGGSQTFGRPRASWNGSVYLVVWEDSSINRGFVPGAVLGKRVDAGGNVLDPNPIEILPGNTPDVAALGSDFLVVSTHEATNHIRYPKAAKVSGGGVVGATVTIGSSYAINVKVEALGTRWLSVWQQHPTHDNPYASIYGTFVNSDGSPVGAFLVASGASTAKKPDIAAGPTQALISYFLGSGANVYNGDIYSKRIQADGTLLDGGSGIQVTSAANAQFFPAGAWTGSEYVVAFEDYRNVPYIELPVSDIYGARVGANGVVLDPNSFVISNDFVPEVNPALGANPGSGHYVIAFANFKYAAPYGAYRVDIQHGLAGSPPTPEATRTPTNTPTPTPPVCIPGNYVVTQSTGAAVVPGTADIGNHCDECATLIHLPFAFTLYDQTYNTVEATANGTLNFVYSGNTGGINFCLPYAGLGYSILPYWEDMMTVGAGNGIFTSISGVAPNRILNIEWRACSFGGANCGGESYNFEVRLHEGVSGAGGRFDIVYGQISGNGSSVTVGVQKDTGQRYTQYVCNTAGLQAGLQLSFTMNNCGSVTPVPSYTPAQPTNTPVQPTGTTGVPSSTPTPAPAPLQAHPLPRRRGPAHRLRQLPRLQHPLRLPPLPRPRHALSTSQTCSPARHSTRMCSAWRAGASSAASPTALSAPATG